MSRDSAERFSKRPMQRRTNREQDDKTSANSGVSEEGGSSDVATDTGLRETIAGQRICFSGEKLSADYSSLPRSLCKLEGLRGPFPFAGLRSPAQCERIMKRNQAQSKPYEFDILY